MNKKFKINQLCFDSQNKEFVKITNGITCDETGGEFAPTEALALRIVSINKGKLVLAYTYRKVNPEFLTEAQDGGQFEAVLYSSTSNFESIGRI